MKTRSWVVHDGPCGNVGFVNYQPVTRRKKGLRDLGLGWQLLAITGVTLLLSSAFFYWRVQALLESVGQ